MRAWLFVCFIICCEMNIDRYIELEQEVKSIIGGAFVKAFNKSSTDFVLLMARGGYHKHFDRPDNDLTPFVLEDRGDLIFDGPSISFEQWEEIFVRAVLFSYHLNDMLLEERNHFIEINGDGPIVINMPMKNNHKELRGVYIKPEPFEGKEEKVKFRYMQIGEII